MKTRCFAALWTMFLIVGASPARSGAQTSEGYSFITGTSGSQVCIGTWVPPGDIALPGVCRGQVVDIAQFTALSARMSVDRLDQLLLALGSIDQKLALSNEQLNRLIDVVSTTQTSLDQQTRQVGDLLQEAITRRFDALPEEILANDTFREELTKLKEEILREVGRLYQKRPPPSAK